MAGQDLGMPAAQRLREGGQLGAGLLSDAPVDGVIEVTSSDLGILGEIHVSNLFLCDPAVRDRVVRVAGVEPVGVEYSVVGADQGKRGRG